MSDNPLAMAGAPQGAGNGMAMQMPQAPGVQAAPQSAKPPSLSAVFENLQKARSRMDGIRQQLDGLMELGDTVTTKDVVKAAGKIVAEHDISPEGMAAMLSEMPDKPDQLAEWLAQHDQEIKQKEQQLTEVTQVIGHKLAVQGFRQLMTHGPQAQMPDAGAAQAPNVMNNSGGDSNA